MNYNEKILEAEKLIQNKEYIKAENLLLSIIDSAIVKNIEDQSATHYSFNNYVETLLFWNIFQPKKKNIEPDINYSQVYYYLGFINIDMKNYEKALEYHKKGLEWNPVNVSIMFEIAAIYKITGKIEMYKEQIEKTHIYIYDSAYMAKYYRELGWYFIEKNLFDIANALYTQSIKYLDIENARLELIFIAKQENKSVRFSTKEEIKKLFSEYNIKSGFNLNVVNMIVEEYQRLSKFKPQSSAVKELSQILYDITLHSKFMTYYELKDEEHGVKIEVPFIWEYIEKDNYEKANIYKDTVFFLVTPEKQTVNVLCYGRCSNEKLDEAVNIDIENIKNNGLQVEQKYNIEGILRCRQVFIKVKQRDKNIRLFRVYKIVNGFLFCTSWQVDCEENDLNQLLTNISNSFEMNVVNSLTVINKNIKVEEDKQTEKDDIIIININTEYGKNKINDRLIKMLHIYADVTIREDKQDPFWTDTAKNVLEMIILINLENLGAISTKQLIQQLTNTNELKTYIKANINKLSKPELAGIMSIKSIIDSNKPFDSVMEILRDAFKINNTGKINLEQNKTKVDNQKNDSDELIEYSQEIPDYPTFKFYFPKSMGQYFKYNSNIFELKKDNIQKIRVMISKCSSEENLEADAKRWIEKNKIDAKMEEVCYKKEKIKDIPIEFYELRRIGGNGTRIYKIGYVNGCRITISGWKINEKEKIINTAFEKISWIEPKKQKEENKPITVECIACNTNFELKWNVPVTEKIFYCKCPNCGVELKKENPNYKEN